MSNPNAKVIASTCLSICCLGLGGCSSYITPGRGADIGLFARQNVTQQDVAPETTAFPAKVVVVRVQEPGYKSMTNEGGGGGRYSVVTVHDIERDEDFERLTRLPLLAKIVPLTRPLLPSSLESDEDLRQAATRLGADMTLIYTIDSIFLDADKATPLRAVKLGAGSTTDVKIATSISALLVDTRTGYLYGNIEETAHGKETTSALSTTDACDRFRLKTERRAFERFLYQFEEQWLKVIEEYGK